MPRAGTGPLSGSRVIDEIGSTTISTPTLPNIKNVNEYVLRQVVEDGYDVNEIPYSGGGPLTVDVQFALQNLKVVNNHVYFKGYLRMWWPDTRLHYHQLVPRRPPPSRIRIGGPTDIWTPDVYFDKATSQQWIFAEGGYESSLETNSHGRVLWDRKARYDSTCDMNFTHLPYDVQFCDFSLSIYSFDDSEVVLRWIEGTTNGSVAMPGWASSITLEDWRITAVYPHAETVPFLDRNYTTLKGTMRLERNAVYYEKYVIQSTILYAVLAWCTFFIQRSAAPARISMAIILFLVISSQVQNQLAALPLGSDGVWLLDFMTTTSLFVFYSIIEYTVRNGNGRKRW